MGEMIEAGISTVDVPASIKSVGTPMGVPAPNYRIRDTLYTCTWTNLLQR